MNHTPTSPVNNTDELDVVGVRNEGGVDLVIACGGPLDESNETIDFLSLKIRNYADIAINPVLFTHFDAKEGPVRIFVSCEYPVSSRAKQTIDSLKNELALNNIDLILVKNMNNP